VPAIAISELILWLLQLATILVVVGLARQIGLLHLRLPPQGSGPVDIGPSIGSRIQLPAVVSLRTQPRDVLVPDRMALVLFANPSCSVCTPVLDAARRLPRVDSEIVLTVAVDGDIPEALRYLNEHGIADGISSTSLSQLDAGHRPLAVALSADGTVLAAGVPNTLELLEVLLGDARHARDSSNRLPSDHELLSIGHDRVPESSPE
jgi:methylamine dehydrogenase accessory protein MauD